MAAASCNQTCRYCDSELPGNRRQLALHWQSVVSLLAAVGRLAGEPPVVGDGANRQLPGLEGKSVPYFSSLDSSIDILKKRAQELIENINESRQKDHALMTNFRDSLKIKVTDLTEKLEERMYQVYNHHSKIIQERLQEFTQKMTKISNLETELKQVCHTVESVYKDLCVQPEVGVVLSQGGAGGSAAEGDL
ncbi:Synaptonemal complex central element protein 2 [Sciurus carolinensis]|uniref:Synaptonemal complex central element protein 2 n=1 Tax=Sciurus carolinensis TaxID=30640 RepID=A0AA41NJ22_SCICA|nr:Synaptonemal complex central element protein 2 [Sciurus carolinensis]